MTVPLLFWAWTVSSIAIDGTYSLLYNLGGDVLGREGLDPVQVRDRESIQLWVRTQSGVESLMPHAPETIHWQHDDLARTY